ncbi:hypothetical protein TWF281_004573 [Arthrobotrys megalospora]
MPPRRGSGGPWLSCTTDKTSSGKSIRQSPSAKAEQPNAVTKKARGGFKILWDWTTPTPQTNRMVPFRSTTAGELFGKTCQFLYSETARAISVGPMTRERVLVGAILLAD